jgi:hypothetical protein
MDGRDDGSAGRTDPAAQHAVGAGQRAVTVGPRRVDGSPFRRLASFPLGWAAVLFTLAELADFVTASRVAREYNPLGAALLAQPLVGLAMKLALVAFVVAVADICARRRPGLARLLLLFGTVVGIFGAISNTHLTPFVGG